MSKHPTIPRALRTFATVSYFHYYEGEGGGGGGGLEIPSWRV